MWLILSLVNASVSGLQNAYYKRAAIQINPILIAWSVLVVSGLLFSPLLLLGIPKLDSIFWITVAIRLILDSAAFVLYIKGVQMAPLSLTIPMTSLVPIFSIATVFLVNHQAPSLLGLIGVVIIVAGLYFLNFDRDTKHLFSPFQAIFQQKGVLYVAIAAILWSIIIALQKLAIDHTNVNFYVSFFQLLWATCFTPIALLTDRRGFLSLFKPGLAKKLVPAGMFDAVQVYAQFSAYLFAIPVYVMAVGSTAILFSSFFGWIFFREKVKTHLIPTILIVVGIIILALAQMPR